MKLLLTSGGITNASIQNALVELLGKPVEESTALLIPTAIYAHPMAGPFVAWQAISGQFKGSFSALGWKSLGVLELTALPSLKEELWLPLLQKIDALLVEGGDAVYLRYWMEQTGVAKLLPSLNAVYVGLSAGSMVMSPRIGDFFVQWKPSRDIPIFSAGKNGNDGATTGDETLGLVDFSIFPHLDHEMMPHNTLAYAEKWAAGIGVPAYAMDDDTALKVVDGSVEVITEGHWKHFAL
jgi:dipeptidase E